VAILSGKVAKLISALLESPCSWAWTWSSVKASCGTCKSLRPGRRARLRGTERIAPPAPAGEAIAALKPTPAGQDVNGSNRAAGAGKAFWRLGRPPPAWRADQGAEPIRGRGVSQPSWTRSATVPRRMPCCFFQFAEPGQVLSPGPWSARQTLPARRQQGRRGLRRAKRL